MALEREGIKLVVEGYQDYVRRLDESIKMTQKFQLSLTNIGKAAPAKATAAVSKGLDTITSSIVKALAVFKLLEGAIRAVWRAFRDLASIAGEAAAELQTLTIRFDNLIGRQLRAAGVTDDVAESIRMAGIHTRNLLGWVTKLAAATPFGAEDISRTVSYALAMGWGVEKAKELTDATLDFAAGMGFGNEVIERIIFNFAQMKAAGKVTATEMRDLARGAFLPLTDILDIAAEKLGVAGDNLQEFRQLAAEGKISVEAFFDAFIEFVRRDFPDAAERMNTTLKALGDNLKDFFRVMVGWNIFGPVVEDFALRASAALEKLFTPAMERRTKLIGLQLKNTFSTIAESASDVIAAFKELLNVLGISMPTWKSVVQGLMLIEAAIKFLGSALSNFIREHVIPFVENMKQKLGFGLGDTARSAYGWGANIIISLAKGIVAAITTVLRAAMNFLGSFLKGWLGPGSPPRVAPQMTEWGAAAMTEFLRGFTLADFDILDDVQGLLRGALEGLVAIGKLGKEDIGGIFVEISEGLIEAIDNFNKTGEISTDILNRLRELGSGFGDELATLLEMEFDLSNAIEAAEEAQKRLNAAIEATKTARGAVHQLVREYNALLRAGADPGVLQAKLAEINAAEDSLYLAQQEEAAAEDAKKQADEALEPLREQVKLQQALLNQLIELARARADFLGGGGAGEPPGEDEDWEFEVPPLDTGRLQEDLEQVLKDIRRMLFQNLKDIWDEIAAEWDLDMGNLGDQIEKWISDVWEKLKTIGTNIKTFWEAAGGVITATLGNMFSYMLGAAGQIAGMIASFLLDMGVSWSQWLVDHELQIRNLFNALAVLGIALSDLAIAIVATALPAIKRFVEQGVQPALSNIITLATNIANWGALIAGDWTNWFKDNAAEIEKFGGTVGGVLVIMSQLVNQLWVDVEPALTTASEALQSLLSVGLKIVNSPEIAAILYNIKRAIEGLSDALGRFALATCETINQMIMDIGDWWEVHGENVSVLIGKGADMIIKLADSLATFWEKAQPVILWAFDSLLAGFGLLVDVLAGEDWETAWANYDTAVTNAYLRSNDLQIQIETGLSPAMTDLETDTEGVGVAVHDNIFTPIDETATTLTTETVPKYQTVGHDIVHGLGTGFENASDEAWAAFKGVLDNVHENTLTLLRMRSPSGLYMDIGKDITAGLQAGITDSTIVANLIAAAVGVVSAIVEAIRTFLRGGSPSQLMADIGVDMMQGLADGVTSMADVVSDALLDAIGGAIENMEDALKFGGALSGFGNFFANLFREQQIDPVREQIEAIDERMAEINELLESGELDMYAFTQLSQELAELTGRRAELADVLAQKEAEILRLQEQQQKLQFLQTQFDLLEKIKAFGLDPEDILGGITLGLDASIEDIMAAMTRAIAAIIAQVEGDLEMGSPSKVFMEIGENVMRGLQAGIASARTVLSGRTMAAQAMAAQPVMTTNSLTFGDTHIYNGMDAALLQQKVISWALGG